MTKIRLWLAYQNLTAKSWRRRAGHPDSSGSRARASSPSKRPLGRSGRNWRNGARAPFRQWTATRQSGTREGWCRIGTPSRISPAEVPGAQTAGSARSGRAARGRGRVRRARRAERAALIEVWPNSAVLTGSRARRTHRRRRATRSARSAPHRRNTRQGTGTGRAASDIAQSCRMPKTAERGSRAQVRYALR
jgi:hypothetical protein